MRESVRQALKADMKAWSLAIIIIALYLTLSGSTMHKNDVLGDHMKEPYLDTSPIPMTYHRLHGVTKN